MPTGVWLPRRLDRAFTRMAADERLKSLLALHGNPEYFSYWDDFLGDSAGTWPADANWGYPATVGTGTEVITLEPVIGGQLSILTGANSGDSAGQAVGLHWRGDYGFYFAARVRLNSLASSKIEVGMVAAVTGDTGAVNVKATPSFEATIGDTCALFVRDTTEDTALTFVSNGGTTDANSDWSGTFAATTWTTVEIVGSGDTTTTGDNVAGYVNGQLVGSGNIDGSVLLTPFFYVETLTTATRQLRVDWAACIGRRAPDNIA